MNGQTASEGELCLTTASSGNGRDTVMQTDDEEEAVGEWARGILCGSKEAEGG